MFRYLLDSKKIILVFFTALIASTPALLQAQDTTDVNIQNPLELTPRQYTIRGVEVEGLTTTREQFVISTSGLQEGTTITYPGEATANAIRQLYRTGLFSDVQILKTRETADGGIYLRIKVLEQPKLAGYEIRGVKRSQRNDIRDRLNLLVGYGVTDASINQALNNIKRYYREKGYWFTEIEVSSSEVDSIRNRKTLYFDVDPGERLEIKDISFEGNDYYDDKKLRKQLDAIKEDKWWKFFSKKLFKEEDFAEAKMNLRNYYSKNGFLDFRIVDDSVYTYTYKKDKLGIKVNIDVHEGPQYHIRNITWDGNTIYTDQQLDRALDFEKGDVFDQNKMQEKLLMGTQSGEDVPSMYRNIGYLFFEANPDIDFVRGDSVDIHVNIVENEIATIQRVSFNGNTKTHDDVIRRTLRTVPGQTYSQQNVIRTVRELGTLGYFRPEAITPNLNPNRENHTVDVSYQLDESQSTDNFEFSGGFGGRGIGLILSAKLNFNNFSLQRALDGEGWRPIPSGDGQKLSIGVQVTGSGYQSYNVGFQEPWLSGRPISLGVNSSYDLIRYRNTEGRNKLFSSSVTLGRQLKWPDDYFSTQTVLQYQLYDVAGGTSFLAEGTSNIMSLKQVIERNSLDNFISPSTGSKFRLSGELAPPLPGFSQFYKIKTQYQNHTTITGKLVLTNSIEYGYLGYLGETQRSNFQRFVLGGTQLQQRQSFLDDNIDLRGFPGGRNGSISPIQDGEQVGGRLYSKYSLELRIPAVQEEQVQAIPYTFFDAGNAYLDFENFSPFDVKRSTGFGLRIYLPILGLVDVSYGYRLDGIPGTSVEPGEWEFLFNIGSPF